MFSFLLINLVLGWIGILAEWMKHEDVRISIPAARALSNLENNEESYKKYLYLLHPSYVGSKKPKVDVVFVHGLLGGVFFTWRQRTKSDLTIGLMGKGQRSSSSENKGENRNYIQHGLMCDVLNAELICFLPD